MKVRDMIGSGQAIKVNLKCHPFLKKYPQFMIPDKRALPVNGYFYFFFPKDMASKQYQDATYTQNRAPCWMLIKRNGTPFNVGTVEVQHDDIAEDLQLVFDNEKTSIEKL